MLPGEVRFDCAGPVFYAFWACQLATWLTRFVSTQPYTLNPQGGREIEIGFGFGLRAVAAVACSKRLHANPSREGERERKATGTPEAAEPGPGEEAQGSATDGLFL